MIVLEYNNNSLIIQIQTHINESGYSLRHEILFTGPATLES